MHFSIFLLVVWLLVFSKLNLHHTSDAAFPQQSPSNIHALELFSQIAGEASFSGRKAIFSAPCPSAEGRCLSVSWQRVVGVISGQKQDAEECSGGCPHLLGGAEREQNNCFYRRQNGKTSCGPLPCVVIDLTVVILGGSRETRASHLIDVSLSAHCNGKHFMLSASRPDLYSVLWHITNYSHFPTQTH